MAHCLNIIIQRKMIYLYFPMIQRFMLSLEFEDNYETDLVILLAKLYLQILRFVSYTFILHLVSLSPKLFAITLCALYIPLLSLR